MFETGKSLSLNKIQVLFLRKYFNLHRMTYFGIFINILVIVMYCGLLHWTLNVQVVGLNLSAAS